TACAGVRGRVAGLAPMLRPSSLLLAGGGLRGSMTRACWDEDLGDGDGVISWRSHVLSWAPWFRAGRPCTAASGSIGHHRTATAYGSGVPRRTAVAEGRAERQLHAPSAPPREAC